MSADQKTTNRNKFYIKTVPATSTTPSIDVILKNFTRIGDSALKTNEEFRKLFQHYSKYNYLQYFDKRGAFEDIKPLAAERGINVNNAELQSGFVLKTTTTSGALACFINIAPSELVAKPTSEPCLNAAKEIRALNWLIPMTQTAPCDDHNENGEPCRIYEVVVHPDALYLAQRIVDFHRTLIQAALDAVEKEHQVTLDRFHLEFVDMQFKESARPNVLQKLAAKIDPPEDNYTTTTAANNNLMQMKVETSNVSPEFSTPKYTIKYRREVDFTEYINVLDINLTNTTTTTTTTMTQPHELIVEIELPLLNSTADCELEVTSQALYLLSECANAKYHLKLNLPHIVDDKNGSAHFDIETKRLTISLPIMEHTRTLMQLNREDSGVESDMREEANSNSSVDDDVEKGEAEHDLICEDISSKHDELKTTSTIFLNNSICYQFPAKFDCNVLDNIISFVLHIRNVRPESLLTTHHANVLHLQFTTNGTANNTTHYAFYLKLPTTNNDIVSTEVEAWENNVVLNLNMRNSSEQLQSYFAGLDKHDLKEYLVFNKFQVLRNSRERKKSIETPVDISVERSECERSVEIEIKSRDPKTFICALTTEDDDDEEHSQQQHNQKKLNKKQKRKNKKRRSLSESACDDIKAYEEIQQQEQHLKASTKKAAVKQQQHKTTDAVAVPTSPTSIKQQQQQQRKQRSFSECRDSANGSSSFKGILKHYSRYNSISSIDESLSSYSCSVEAGVSQSFSDIPEEQHENNVGLSESCKKTVRFNEVIKKQIFRNHSSILGQRKKNQKRRDRKQRALRRLSEGDSTDYDKLVDLPTEAQYFKNKNKINECGNNGLRKQTQHDSGLDLTNDKISNANKITTKSNKLRMRLESESSELDANKNALMFEMDM